MSRSRKIIAGAAMAGLLVPLSVEAYSRLTGTELGNTALNLCPTAIIWMAINNPSTTTRFVVTLVILTTNALLYAMVGAAIAFVVGPGKSK